MKKLTGDQVYKMAIEKVNNNGIVYEFGSEKQQEDIQKIVDEYNNTMTKIPPGVYSTLDGKLRVFSNGYALMDNNNEKVATIGFSLPGVPQLEVRERSAEEFLQQYHNNNETDWLYQKKDVVAKLLNLYRSQPIAPVSEEEIRKIRMTLGYGGNSHIEAQILEVVNTLSRTQSGYTREQMEEAMLQMAEYILDCKEGKIENINSGDKCDAIIESLTPSITSVTIGEENNIIDIKYK